MMLASVRRRIMAVPGTARFKTSKPSVENFSLNQIQQPDVSEKSDFDMDELDWSHLKQAEKKYGTEDYSTSDAGRAEQKEEMIFKEVLGHVLAPPRQKPRPRSSIHDSTVTPLSNSILALFEENKKSRSERLVPTAASLMDGLLKPSEASTPPLSPEAIARRENVNKALSLIFEHIDSVNSNRELMTYFEDIIVPRYNTSSVVTDNSEPAPADDPLVGPDTVAPILEKCIASLLFDYEDPVGAIHLFELAKHHSVEFFSQACSAEVYNHIIKVRWKEYRDLYAVVNLAAEIAINAIPPTLETTEILSKVYRDAIDSAKGLGSTAYGMPLWTGQEEKRLEELNRYRTRFQSSWASKPILRF